MSVSAPRGAGAVFAKWDAVCYKRGMRRACLVFLLCLVSATADASHDSSMPMEDPVVQRFAGHVSALGMPVGGHLYSFQTAELKTKYPPGALRSWRLTFVSGEKLGEVFRVADNGESDVRVTGAGAPLDGIAIGDAFLIEDQIERSVPARR